MIFTAKDISPMIPLITIFFFIWKISEDISNKQFQMIYKFLFFLMLFFLSDQVFVSISALLLLLHRTICIISLESLLDWNYRKKKRSKCEKKKKSLLLSNANDLRICFKAHYSFSPCLSSSFCLCSFLPIFLGEDQ